jgi:S-disulfanyl-L-cysteine oxidoreductase SoxD
MYKLLKSATIDSKSPSFPRRREPNFVQCVLSKIGSPLEPVLSEAEGRGRQLFDCSLIHSFDTPVKGASANSKSPTFPRRWEPNFVEYVRNKIGSPPSRGRQISECFLVNVPTKSSKTLLSASIGVHRRLNVFAFAHRSPAKSTKTLLSAFICVHLWLPPTTATATPNKFPNIGRPATEAEVKAWDIDVRPDFKGLPKGSGSVKKGQDVWEAKCESCHGTFGESNEVFTPIAGGITKRDIETGRVANLKRTDYPQRSTLMKLSEISTLWDYINRAMPWNAPKTMTVEEVYAVTAYILNLGDIVPADFVLSDSNMADVQKRLPNRDGLKKFTPLWDVRGKGDVSNVACMVNCATSITITSQLPEHARNSHGNLAEQSRLIGAMRGVDTTMPPVARNLNAQSSADAPNVAKPTPVAPIAPIAQTASAAQLARKYTCNACHAAASKLVGPSYAEIAKKYQGDGKAVALLMDKIRKGGAGVWGAIPMPPHPQIPEDDLRQLVEWNLRGGK